MKLTISLVLLCASLCASLCAQPCPNAGPVLWGNAIPEIVTEANCGQTIVLAYYPVTVVLPPQVFSAAFNGQVLQPIPFGSNFHVSVYNAQPVSVSRAACRLVRWAVVCTASGVHQHQQLRECYHSAAVVAN